MCCRYLPSSEPEQESRAPSSKPQSRSMHIHSSGPSRQGSATTSGVAGRSTPARPKEAPTPPMLMARDHESAWGLHHSPAASAGRLGRSDAPYAAMQPGPLVEASSTSLRTARRVSAYGQPKGPTESRIKQGTVARIRSSQLGMNRQLGALSILPQQAGAATIARYNLDGRD